MTLGELRTLVMFQTNNDEEDLDEFQPAVDQYLNEGYDKLVEVYAHTHLDEDEYTSLSGEGDEPELPEWTHRAIADYATYMVYRNGNALKQNRGDRYLQMFNETLTQLRYRRNGSGGTAHFRNLYTD